MSTSEPQASACLQQFSNVPNCRHALAGCNLVSLRLSSLPKLGQQKHTCCNVRQKRTSIANSFSIKWCLGCWLLGQPWMGQHTSLQHVFCLWLASQTVRQPSIKQCMLSRPCMLCGYYMVTSEKATFCVYPRQNKAARFYSLVNQGFAHKSWPSSKSCCRLSSWLLRSLYRGLSIEVSL